MNYFTKDYLNFFKELAADNTKEWFDANRKRYEKSVKKPFEVFVADLIEAIKKEDKKIEITHKDAIFRINRDIRFSADKSPYKLNRSAIISPKGRKDKAFPGLYFEMGPEHFRVYGGVYLPDKFQLQAIRETIAQNPGALEKLMMDKPFTQTFGKVLGEQNKVVPKEFKEAAEKMPLIYNKQFYWFTQFKPEEILNENVLETTLHAYRANKGMMDYFAEAME